MTFMSLSDGVAPNYVMLCEHRIKNGLSNTKKSYFELTLRPV